MLIKTFYIHKMLKTEIVSMLHLILVSETWKSAHRWSEVFILLESCIQRYEKPGLNRDTTVHVNTMIVSKFW